MPRLVERHQSDAAALALERGDAAVGHRGDAPAVVGAEADDLGRDRADVAAVADDGGRAPVRSLQDALERIDRAPVQLDIRLAVRVPDDASVAPDAIPGGVTSLDLLPGAADEPADVDLPQGRVDHRLEPGRRLDGHRGLAGPGEVARVEQVDADPGQVGAEQPRLLAAGVVERSVGLPLPAALTVPVGLAVSG